ncbi:MAG: hypothetical protein SGCHY_002656 [Lobulomycetales sp.]
MPTCSVCSKASTLQCPTCLKQGLSDAFFCSQDCFKGAWTTHKLVHKKKTFNPWPNYPYTGTLRPVYPLSPKRTVPESIVRPDYADDGFPYSEQKVRASTVIQVLSPDEIEKMRTVCRLSREILEEGAKVVKPGATTDEIDRVVHDACIERDCYPSPLNYHNFPKSVCTSVNEVICHGIPDQYELKDGDIVNIDVSAYHDGFHGDLNSTYAVGTLDDAGQNLVTSTRECLDKAIAMCKPGVAYRDLGAVIQKHATSKGLSVVRTYCGHGINRLFHCAPNVPHYAKNKAVGIMKPGKDDWTAVTRDGKRSAQFEETLLVTETGIDVLTR